MQGWQDKLAAVWKGPSWQPGKPRLGEDADKLDVRFLYYIILNDNLP